MTPCPNSVLCGFPYKTQRLLLTEVAWSSLKPCVAGGILPEIGRKSQPKGSLGRGGLVDVDGEGSGGAFSPEDCVLSFALAGVCAGVFEAIAEKRRLPGLSRVTFIPDSSRLFHRRDAEYAETRLADWQSDTLSKPIFAQTPKTVIRVALCVLRASAVNYAGWRHRSRDPLGRSLGDAITSPLITDANQRTLDKPRPQPISSQRTVAPSSRPRNPSPMSRTLAICRIPRLDYEPAFALQRACVETLHKSGKDAAALILLEHSPVITIGRSGTAQHILAPEEELKKAGVAVHETNRGGDVTYHGPGQIVGYPILPLRYHGKDIHRYLRTLEALLIDTLGEYGITAFRKDGLTGVWTDKGKIVSIGVAISHWIAYHGFALNLNPNMRHFHLIHPCGLVGVRMVGMKDLLTAAPARNDVEDTIIRRFRAAFDFDDATETTKDKLREMLK